MGLSTLGFSVPVFWIGLILIMVFSVQLGWLPAIGRGDTVFVLGLEVSFLDARRSLASADAGLHAVALHARHDDPP